MPEFLINIIFTLIYNQSHLFQKSFRNKSTKNKRNFNLIENLHY